MALACSYQAIDVFTTIGHSTPDMAFGQIAALVPSDEGTQAYLEQFCCFFLKNEAVIRLGLFNIVCVSLQLLDDASSNRFCQLIVIVLRKQD